MFEQVGQIQASDFELSLKNILFICFFLIAGLVVLIWWLRRQA